MNKTNTIVELKFKKTGKTEYFKTLTEIFSKYERDDVGIGLQALWNAISPAKGNGQYENQLVAIRYQEPKAWE
jgi:hypothetical protein